MAFLDKLMHTTWHKLNQSTILVILLPARASTLSAGMSWRTDKHKDQLKNGAELNCAEALIGPCHSRFHNGRTGCLAAETSLSGKLFFYFGSLGHHEILLLYPSSSYLTRIGFDHSSWESTANQECGCCFFTWNGSGETSLGCILVVCVMKWNWNWTLSNFSLIWFCNESESIHEYRPSSNENAAFDLLKLFLPKTFHLDSSAIPAIHLLSRQERG